MVLSVFQGVEHLSWLGFFKDLSEGPHKPSPFYHKRSLRKTREECEHVREKFLQMRWGLHEDGSIRPELCCPLTCLSPAALWRSQRTWGSTWRPRPLITGELWIKVTALNVGGVLMLLLLGVFVIADKTLYSSQYEYIKQRCSWKA